MPDFKLEIQRQDQPSEKDVRRASFSKFADLRDFVRDQADYGAGAPVEVLVAYTDRDGDLVKLGSTAAEWAALLADQAVGGARWLIVKWRPGTPPETISTRPTPTAAAAAAALDIEDRPQLHEDALATLKSAADLPIPSAPPLPPPNTAPAPSNRHIHPAAPAPTPTPESPHTHITPPLVSDTRRCVDPSYPLSQVEKWVDMDLHTARKAAESFGYTIPALNDVLTNMVLQIGKCNVAEFKKMHAALKFGDFNTAADELRNSKWGRDQRPSSARRLADEVRKLKNTPLSPTPHVALPLVDDIDPSYPLSQIEKWVDGMDLQTARKAAESFGYKIPVLNDVLTNMVLQMGKSGVEEFKKMHAALKLGDFNTAAYEMRNSKWGRDQRPSSAERLAAEVRELRNRDTVTKADATFDIL